jgi:hypothetical protein
MHKNATKCNETLSKWCKYKHGASKIIDTLETYHHPCPPRARSGSPEVTNARETPRKFPRVWWPRLVGEKGRSSFSSHRLPRAIKACRRRTCSHAARRVNVRPSIYRGLPRVWPHSPPSPQFILHETSRAMAGYGSDDGTANNGFGRRSLTSGRAVCCTWRDTRRRRTSARPEAGA